MFNPINMASNMMTYERMCNIFDDDFQKCIGHDTTKCIPQPAHIAYNDTFTYLCHNDEARHDFQTFNPCLTRVAQSHDAKHCVEMFNDIVWDDSSKMVCRKLNKMMDCIYPLIERSTCSVDALMFTYRIFSTMAVRYRAGCVLNAPASVQFTSKLDMNFDILRYNIH